MATAVAVIAALWKAGWLQVIGGALIGWLFPSPIQKALNAQAAVRAAEQKADATGDVTDLDKLP